MRSLQFPWYTQTANLCGFYYVCLALLLTVFGVESRMGDINRELVRATESIAKDLGIRFCTHCNQTRAAHNGKFKTTANGRTRWICAECVKRGKNANTN
jgi:hypothetical protein